MNNQDAPCTRKFVGVVVKCTECGRTKKPQGRAAPLGSSFCEGVDECGGYYLDPPAGCLWPGEGCTDYGYCHCHVAALEAEAEANA